MKRIRARRASHQWVSARVQGNVRPMLFADDDNAWNCDTDLSEDSRDLRRAEEERHAEAQRQQQREQAAANRNAPAPHPLHILRAPLGGFDSSSSLRRRCEPSKASTTADPGRAAVQAKPNTSLFKQLAWSLGNARRRDSRTHPSETGASRGTSLCLLCCRSR